MVKELSSGLHQAAVNRKVESVAGSQYAEFPEQGFPNNPREAGVGYEKYFSLATPRSTQEGQAGGYWEYGFSLDFELHSHGCVLPAFAALSGVAEFGVDLGEGYFRPEFPFSTKVGFCETSKMGEALEAETGCAQASLNRKRKILGARVVTAQEGVEKIE
jgi:hypothetical protein